MHMRNWDIASLKGFETEIADLFNTGKIKAPIHLSDGNEEHLIGIFQDIRDEDWVFCSWRSHYQCLLKGVPVSRVRTEIVAGRSISLCFPDFKIYSSAIVGGQIPLAVGTALSLKRKGSAAHVWCFIGDMTSETGIAQTAIRYSEQHKLPITFIVEDNRISVLTETRSVWNSLTLRFEERSSPIVRSYPYKSRYPHSGAGVRVEF